MLKIVEVHPAANPQSEYVVLQNQGLVTVNLRGWAVCTEDYLEGSAQEAVAGMYVFRDDIPVKPYARVVLFTGEGIAGWVPTVDGKQAYCAYWGRTQADLETLQNRSCAANGGVAQGCSACPRNNARSEKTSVKR